jgi:DNA-binding NarL/FixJ family response regulator
MSSAGSVTQSLLSLRSGSQAAATSLVEHFLPILRRRLSAVAKTLRIHDEDDIAISAFYEFCKAVENSRFEDVADRTQLWQVLSMIAIRKANDFHKIETAAKRGANSNILSLENIEQHLAAVDQWPGLQLEMFELCDKVLRSIKDERLRNVADLKMRGYTNSEIAQQVGVTIRTVQLMVAKIKESFSCP